MNQRRAETVLFLVLVFYLQSVNGFENCPSPALPASGNGASRPLSSRVQGRPPALIPYTHAVSVGRFCRVKGPSPRRFAPVGRTNPLTRHTLVDGAQKKDPAEARSDESYVRATHLLCRR